MKKHLLVIATAWPSLEQPTAGIFLKEFLILLKDKLPVTIVVPHSCWHKTNFLFKQEFKIFTPRYLSFGRKILGVYTNYLSARIFTNSVCNCIKSKKIQFDFVYSHFFFAAFAGSFVSQKTGKPHLCNLAEGTLDHFGGWSKKLISHVLNGCKVVFFPSNESKNRTEQFLKKKVKSTILPNGTNTDKFFPCNKALARKILGLPQNKYIIFYPGGDESRKGWPLVKKAIQKLQTKLFFCVGKYEKQMHSPNLIYQGYFPHHKMPYLYNACDVMLLPTKSEGMANTIIEGNACKTKIITSPIGSNKDVLGAKYPYFLKKNNLFYLRKCIDRTHLISIKHKAPFSNKQKVKCFIKALD